MTAPRIPLAAQTTEALLARIRADEWAPGSRLPGETTLAQQLGVGRSTVREAIRTLATQGILLPKHGSGVYLADSEDHTGWDTLLLRSSIRAVLEARIAIETESAALAATRRTPETLDALTALLTARVAHPNDIEATVNADTAFHRAVVAAADNPLLLELFDSLTPRSHTAMVDMLRLRTLPPDGPDHDAHQELVSAIRDGDATAAAAASRHHLQALKDALA